MKRVLCIVLDSVGCGNAPDAAAYGDAGAEILVQLGEEHLRTGKPILYTSADSVL